MGTEGINQTTDKYRLAIANHKGSNDYLDFFYVVSIMLSVTKDRKSCFTINLPRPLNKVKSLNILVC